MSMSKLIALFSLILFLGGVVIVSIPSAEAQSGCDIKTTTEDEFEGWEGSTIVELANGQIWKQTEYYYYYMYAYRPRVCLYSKNGSWYMTVKGVDRPVGVKRLK